MKRNELLPGEITTLNRIPRLALFKYAVNGETLLMEKVSRTAGRIQTSGALHKFREPPINYTVTFVAYANV